MLIRDFTNPFGVSDLTQELLIIPNKWGLLNQLSIFTNDSVAANTATVESREGTIGLLSDKVRGERAVVNQDVTRKVYTYPIPHFPYDDFVLPQDIQDKRAFGSNLPETEAAVLARKLERIRQNHAVTLEAARAYTLTTGNVYAPNGTVAGNFYSDFGITRKEIDFALGTATTEILEKSEEGIAHIQDNIKDGSVVNEIIVICSPEFFAKLIKHPKVVQAYQFYTSTQEPLRERVGGTGLYREFRHGSVRYIEYRGSYNGGRLIPAGEAFMLPMGTSDSFTTYFGPANKFEYVNTAGQEAYVFVWRDPKGGKIEVETETNFVNILRRPQVVVKLSSSN